MFCKQVFFSLFIERITVINSTYRYSPRFQRITVKYILKIPTVFFHKDGKCSGIQQKHLQFVEATCCRNL